MKALAQANLKNAERRSKSKAIEVVLQVRDIKHARSEEVLQFCLKELEEGTTYNDLRLKLGLGPASIDKKWRRIREIIGELILPDSEEEALKADMGYSGAIMNRIEKFMKKVEERASYQGENEHHFLKLELESMKILMEKANKRTEHFLKMKDIKTKETRSTGTTIVFNNAFPVARPGDTELAAAAKLVTELSELNDEQT